MESTSELRSFTSDNNALQPMKKPGLRPGFAVAGGRRHYRVLLQPSTWTSLCLTSSLMAVRAGERY